MELGGVLRARRAPATGGKEAAQGATRCDRPRAGWRQSLLSNRGESSPQEEPPAGGSTRLGEKREMRGELGEELASPAAAHAPTASPTAAPPPSSPGAGPGSMLASVPLLRLARRPSLAGATSVRTRQGCRGAGAECGRGLGPQRRGAGGAGPSPASRWFVPAGHNRRDCAPSSTRSPQGDVASLGRSLPGAGLVRRAGPGPAAEGPSRARLGLGRPHR